VLDEERIRLDQVFFKFRLLSFKVLVEYNLISFFTEEKFQHALI